MVHILKILEESKWNARSVTPKDAP